MEKYSTEKSTIVDPLDFLAKCSLEECLILETLDHNFISEQINNNDTDIESIASIDSEDLKEMLKNPFIEDKDIQLEDLMECLGNLQNKNMPQQVMCSDLKSTSYDNFTLNVQKTKLNKTTKKIESFLLQKDDIDKQMCFIQNNLEKTMLKSHMSRQHLYKPSKMDATIDAYQKTKNSFNNTSDSKISLKIFDKSIDVSHAAFFSGKRKTLTNELEISRIHLKNYGHDMLNRKKVRKSTSCTFAPSMA